MIKRLRGLRKAAPSTAKSSLGTRRFSHVRQAPRGRPAKGKGGAPLHEPLSTARGAQYPDPRAVG